MAVTQATDDDLRHLIYTHGCVVVKFTSPGCSVCKTLAPAYLALSNEPEFKDIKFLQVDSEENPIASKMLNQSSTPFVITYKGGILLECDVVSTEIRMIEMLNHLKKESRKSVSL